MGKATRTIGAEFRAAGWAARHPGVVGVPVAFGVSMIDLGMYITGGIVAGVAAAGLGWYRAHPDTFDPIVGARLRAFRRRWLAYIGPRWVDIMHHCELVKTNRRTDRVRTPRIIRVKSATPTLDTIYVRLLRGQHAGNFTDRADALADALMAHRVAVTRVKPGVVALTVERGNPFVEIVPPIDIPETVEDVTLSALEFGDDEYGEPWTEDWSGGKHFFGVGATGAGKSSMLWSPLRAAGPAIREGIVRVWMVDLKGGIETQAGEPLFYRYAITPDAAVKLIKEFRDNMKASQAKLRAAGKRKSYPCLETPVDWLMIDEFAMLTVLGDGKIMREACQLLGEIMTQGRATGEHVAVYCQEPDKQTNPLRELFNTRVCMRVTSDVHVNMVLGEDMRERGALADQIPMDSTHTGTGFKAHGKSRLPVRVRAAITEDPDIAELVRTCTPRPMAEVRALLVNRTEQAAS